jgi:hypothetical protein
MVGMAEAQQSLNDRLTPPEGKVDAVVDSDTYNEIDDQFAVAYALLSHGHMTVEAVYAAPFHNERSSSAGDGMRKSYEEIVRIAGVCVCGLGYFHESCREAGRKPGSQRLNRQGYEAPSASAICAYDRCTDKCLLGDIDTARH